jgi:HPr kinase/phosphorylase
MLVHATSVALKIARQPWRAVLLRGPSGAGKSDLALRLIDRGARLVADDQTHLARKGRSLIASAPPAIAGRMEVRGLGIADVPRARLIARAPIALIVDLVASEQVERLPDPVHEIIEGISLPVIALAAFEASAVAKLHLALAQIAAP